MLIKTKITLAAMLVLASASASLAATAHRNAYGNAPGWAQGYSGGLVPGSQAERDWFARASRPSNL
jgi:Spy/CpxP family protein refolding chaperone